MPLFRRQLTALMAFGLLLVAVGCSDLTSYFPLGRLSVQVLDANNAGVQAALLDLYKVEGGASILWRGTATSSNGIGEFGASDGGVIAGEYFIRLATSVQYELAPGETNDRPVTVAEGDDLLVTFRTVPRSGPGP